MSTFRQLWSAHPRGLGLSLAAWLLLWAATLATWLYDEAGLSVGMPPLPSLLHLAAPLLAGALIGWWTQPRTAALAGLLFAAVNFLVLLLWSTALIALGRVQPGPEVMPAWAGLGEAAAMGLVYTLLGGGLGLAGGLLAALARRLRPAPAGH